MKLFFARIDNDMEFPDNEVEYEYFVASNYEEAHKKALKYLEEIFGEGSFELAETKLIDGYYVLIGDKVPTVTRPVIGGVTF